MSVLGREIAPAITIGRPGFRHYPAPAGGVILALPLAGVAYFGFSTFRGALSPGFYWFIVACAALLVLLSAVTTFFWIRFGLTISLRELGVAITARGKEHELRYADIDAITIRDKRRYDDRRMVAALTRTILLEAEGRGIKAQFVTPPQEALDNVLDELVERIAEHPRSRAGRGWSIEQSTLEARRERVPLPAITAAGVFEREVRLWKHRDEEHFFSVPYESKNARVLLALARRSAPAAAHAEPASSSGIGRLLFARRTSLISGAGNTLMAGFCLAMVWMVLERYLHVDPQVALGAVIAGFVLWIFYSIYRATVGYRFHERAVVRTSLLGTRTLAYANVAVMRWSESTTLLQHAIPLGTTVKAKLVPDDGSPALSVRLHRFRSNDGDLRFVRDAIAHPIAHALHARLDRGDEIPWTAQAKFTGNGLVLKGNVLPYDQPLCALFRDGFLMLYRDNWRKPLALLQSSDVNFYPGLVLFELVMEQLVTERAQTTG
jgi:hypothetical protein